MISQTAEYALRAVVFLTERHDRPYTIHEIAATTRVPEGYLAKVMQSLARDQVVHSQRGLGGGFTLSRPADELSVYDVVQAVDPIKRITRCPLNNPAHATELCGLHRRLDEAAALLERSFRETTLAEVASKPAFGAATT